MQISKLLDYTSSTVFPQGEAHPKGVQDGQLFTHLGWVAPLMSSWREKADLHWGEHFASETELITARHCKLGKLLLILVDECYLTYLIYCPLCVSLSQIPINMKPYADLLVEKVIRLTIKKSVRGHGAECSDKA